MSFGANCKKGWIENGENVTDTGCGRAGSHRGRSMELIGRSGLGVELSEVFNAALDIIEEGFLPLSLSPMKQAM